MSEPGVPFGSHLRGVEVVLLAIERGLAQVQLREATQGSTRTYRSEIDPTVTPESLVEVLEEPVAVSVGE